MPDEAAPWSLIAALRASNRRRQVFEAIAEKPRSATDVAQVYDGVSRQEASKHIYWLKRQDPTLIKCMTPERPHHRIYAVTETGARAAENL
jgi:predicted transcriptional regulator